MPYQTVNPYANQLVASYEFATDDQIDATIEKAHDAFLLWRTTGFGDRSRVLGPDTAAIATDGQLGGLSHAASAGACDLSCNLISGNDAAAISAAGGSVQGNMIGLSSLGAAMPNAGAGIDVHGSELVGGSSGGGGAYIGNRVEDNAGAAVEDLGPGGHATVEDNVMQGNAAGISVDSSDPARIPLPATVLSAVRTPTGITVTGSVSDLASRSAHRPDRRLRQPRLHSG